MAETPGRSRPGRNNSVWHPSRAGLAAALRPVPGAHSGLQSQLRPPLSRAARPNLGTACATMHAGCCLHAAGGGTPEPADATPRCARAGGIGSAGARCCRETWQGRSALPRFQPGARSTAGPLGPLHPHTPGWLRKTPRTSRPHEHAAVLSPAEGHLLPRLRVYGVHDLGPDACKHQHAACQRRACSSASSKCPASNP